MSARNLTIIAACDPSGIIGKVNGLPWDRLEGDLKRFRALTLGKVVIMGRRTVDSLPKPLEGRTVIQISRAATGKSLMYNMTVPKIKDALALALSLRKDDEDVFVAGGGEIYRYLWCYASTLCLTITKDFYEGDVRVQEFVEVATGNDPQWVLVSSEELSDSFYNVYKRVNC